jgi:hypothetical protein
VLLVDAANVVGSRPTGWWRDRSGAARDLVARARHATVDGAIDPPVVIVLEGAARPGAPEGVLDGVEVVHAPGEGDATLVAIAEDALAGGATVLLVSADRELGGRVRRYGAEVAGPTWLWERLPPTPSGLP